MRQLELKADWQINELADRFLERKIGVFLNITFGMYVDNPEYYDKLMDALNSGHGLQLSEAGELLTVELGR